MRCDTQIHRALFTLTLVFTLVFAAARALTTAAADRTREPEGLELAPVLRAGVGSTSERAILAAAVAAAAAAGAGLAPVFNVAWGSTVATARLVVAALTADVDDEVTATRSTGGRPGETKGLAGASEAGAKHTDADAELEGDHTMARMA